MDKKIANMAFGPKKDALRKHLNMRLALLSTSIVLERTMLLTFMGGLTIFVHI